jgi:hypothetical protein
MLHLALAFLLVPCALAAPVSNAAAATTVGKIRGVADPIYHLYLQASPKNGKHLTRTYLSSVATDRRIKPRLPF